MEECKSAGSIQCVNLRLCLIGCLFTVSVDILVVSRAPAKKFKESLPESVNNSRAPLLRMRNLRLRAL